MKREGEIRLWWTGVSSLKLKRLVQGLGAGLDVQPVQLSMILSGYIMIYRYPEGE